jgi:hypothetical protein
MGPRQILWEGEVLHNTLRLHLARLERQGMIIKANGFGVSKLPQKHKRGIKTIFNHFRDKPARFLTLVGFMANRVNGFWLNRN